MWAAGALTDEQTGLLADLPVTVQVELGRAGSVGMLFAEYGLAGTGRVLAHADSAVVLVKRSAMPHRGLVARPARPNCPMVADRH